MDKVCVRAVIYEKLLANKQLTGIGIGDQVETALEYYWKATNRVVPNEEKGTGAKQGGPDAQTDKR